MTTNTITSLLWKTWTSVIVIVKYGIMLLPGAFLWLDWVFHQEEGTSLVYPEAYDLFFIALMVVHSMAYFYCMHRRQRGSPMVELVVNLLMVAGIVQDALVGVRLDLWNFFQLCFALPIMLLVSALIRNCRAELKNMTYV